MASSYTGLGTELMTTGENAGTWGTTTNTNLQILEQISGGYTAQSIAGSAQTTTLSVSDGSTGAVLAHRIIEFTGTITGNQVVTIPLDVQTFYIVKNNTSGAYTVQFKYVSGSGSSVTWAATDKGTKLLYAAADHASNPNLVDSNIGGVGAVDLDGNELTLDADSDTSITASTDDQIDFEISGADDFTMTANAFNVLTSSHVTFADSSNAKFGTGNDMLIYHDGTNSYITNAQGALKIATETSGIAVTIGHTTSEVTIADNLTVTGTLTLGSNAELTEAELEFLDGITAGTAAASKAMVLDSNADITGGRNLTISGELDAATLDISGNADIDGTTNLDAVDIDGAVQLDATLTVGADDQGYDIIFYGDTASAYMMWDTSADDLILAGAAGIDLAGDIDVDGTANLDAVDIDGAVQIDGAVTVGVDGTGLDVKFFGDTAGSFLLWDQSDDALELTDSSPIKIGDGGDMQVYHDGTNSYITNSQGALKVATETSGIAVTIGHTTSEVTIADNLTVTGTLTLGSNAELTEAELEMLDGITAGTAAASKAMVADSNIDITGGRNITISGELDAATLDISGNADIDGTTNLDAVDIDGAVQLDSTLTVGVDDTGHDVKFFGATASAYMLWDESTDDLILAGAAKLYLYDAAGGEHISSDGTDLTIAAGADLNLTATTDINVPQNVGITFGDDGEKIEGDGTNLTISSSGTATIDSTGNINLDGSNILEMLSAGTGFWKFTKGGSASFIINPLQDMDLIFQGNDGGANTTLLTLDASEAGAATFNDKVIATELDISGNCDIDGTTNLDAVDIDGAVQIDGTVTVGVDDTGLDVKFFGASAGAYMEWDQSEDQLRIMGASADATTSTGKLLLATSLTDINANDVIGKIEFQAPHEAGGTDAITVAASIQAIAQGTFSASVNATDLVFYTGHSEANTEKFRFTSQGEIGVGGANYGTDGQVLTSGGAGAAPAWEDAAGGGTDWKAVKTGAFTAVAGEGYFVNTTSSAFTATLPAGTIGDEVSFIDYAGTFDSNNLTVDQNGSEKIHGSTDALTVATERAAFTLVFTDSTQGWLLKNN